MTRKRVDFTTENQDSASAPKYKPIACAANGCPCMLSAASITLHENVCVFHSGLDSHYWPAVTEFLEQHQSLIELAKNLIYNPFQYSFYGDVGLRRIEQINRFLDSCGLFDLHVRTDLPGFYRSGNRTTRCESAYEFGQRLQGWLIRESRVGFTKSIEQKESAEEINDGGFTSMLQAVKDIEHRVRTQNEGEYF